MSDQYDFTNVSWLWDDWLQPDDSWALEAKSMKEPHTPGEAPLGSQPHPGLPQARPTIGQSDNPDEMVGQVNTFNSSVGAQQVDTQVQVEAAAPIRPLQRLIYTASNCATCNAPLDTSEQTFGLLKPNIFCTRTKNLAGHHALACLGVNCSKTFSTFEDLEVHFFWRGDHRTLCCALPDCGTLLCGLKFGEHIAENHPDFFRCAQCGISFPNGTELDHHGTLKMHGAYVCGYPECGSVCSRIGDLRRHQTIHQTHVKKYPCPHCRKHRGQNGFKRKDHLRQHIRNYHHIDVDNVDANSPTDYPCPRDGCDRVGDGSFKEKKLLQLHLKKDHPSPFQCPHSGCNRVGTKGWFRKRDMVKHIQKAHGS